MIKAEFFMLCKACKNPSLEFDDTVGHGRIIVKSDKPIKWNNHIWKNGFLIYVSLWFDRHKNSRAAYERWKTIYTKFLADYKVACDSCTWCLHGAAENTLGICRHKIANYLRNSPRVDAEGLNGGVKVLLNKATCKGKFWEAHV